MTSDQEVRSGSFTWKLEPCTIAHSYTVEVALPAKKPDLVLLTLSIFKISCENRRLSVVSVDFKLWL
ncbi:putative stearoyl-CoA 9-desaturase [Sesbania bispinosa]|nr:putative stearoyl-CoA 9-desaturase [Sesbania bispinosa]